VGSSQQLFFREINFVSQFFLNRFKMKTSVLVLCGLIVIAASLEAAAVEGPAAEVDGEVDEVAAGVADVVENRGGMISKSIFVIAEML
jgi:hypothetical protein